MKFVLEKPLRKMTSKERKTLKNTLIEAFFKEYGAGVYNRLLNQGLIKWSKS